VEGVAERSGNVCLTDFNLPKLRSGGHRSELQKRKL